MRVRGAMTTRCKSRFDPRASGENNKTFDDTTTSWCDRCGPRWRKGRTCDHIDEYLIVYRLPRQAAGFSACRLAWGLAFVELPGIRPTLFVAAGRNRTSTGAVP